MDILKDFNQKLAQNPQWSKDYLDETNMVDKVLNSTNINNRFNGADTSNMAVFLADMNSKFQNTAFESKDFLTRNMEYFALILGKQL
ncbi:hypothetical protein D3C73_1379970 [compost metagenome]